jgi:hypothetical protein
MSGDLFDAWSDGEEKLTKRLIEGGKQSYILGFFDSLSRYLLERVFESYTLPQKLIDRYCLPWHTPAMERDYSSMILIYFHKVIILLKKDCT